jgi:hypothetical protein
VFSLGFAYIHTTDYKQHHPAASTGSGSEARLMQVKPLAQQQYQQNAPLEAVQESGAGSNAAPTSSTASADSSSTPTTKGTQTQQSSGSSGSSNQGTSGSSDKGVIRNLLSKLSL